MFCLVLFRPTFCYYCQESKRNDFFFIFKNIRIIVSLDGTLSVKTSALRLQVPFGNKGSLENFVLQYCIFPELFVRKACLQAEKTIETVKE